MLPPVDSQSEFVQAYASQYDFAEKHQPSEKNHTKSFSTYTVGKNSNFLTIQSAVNAANMQGGGTIYIDPGVYREDLTLFPGITLEGCGIADLKFIVIEGQHSLPMEGEIGFNHIFFSHPTAIFNTGLAKGKPNILFRSCVFEVDDGYTLDIPHLGGTVIFFDCLSAGRDNGFMYNPYGSCVPTIFNITIGGGGGKKEMQVNSDGLFFNVHFKVKSRFQGGNSVVTINGGCWCENTLIAANGACIRISNSNLETKEQVAVCIEAPSQVTIDNCSIESNAENVIEGNGMVRLGSVVFPMRSKIDERIGFTQSATFYRTTLKTGQAGNGEPLPSAPAGYIITNINGCEYQIPYYSKAQE